jgi:membrane protein YdbS with pleckstrin-like domain
LRPPHNRVSSKAIWYWTARAVLGWAVVALIELVWMSSAQDGRFGLHVAGLAATAAIAVLHVIIMPQWRYRVHRWEVTSLAVFTQSGWFHQEQRIAPVSRIQSIDSARGPIEQLFGLANLTVTTASAAGPLKIHGLEYSTVLRLLDELTEDIQAAPGDAT